MSYHNPLHYRGRGTYRGRSGTPRNRSEHSFGEGSATPFQDDSGHPDTGGAEATTDKILRLRLEGQVLISQALEMENRMMQDELAQLQEQSHARRPAEDWVTFEIPRLSHTEPARPLAERIDWTQSRPPPHCVTNTQGRVITIRQDRSTPPTVITQPDDIHPHFLPLGTRFQEGGTGNPVFSRIQDWPDAIHQNPSVRPCGVRKWGNRLVNVDDLAISLAIGKAIYGGNRPPGRQDPVEPKRPWKLIEVAFYRGTVALILQPHLFDELGGQLTQSQRTPTQQLFLTAVENPNLLPLAAIAEHLIRSEITEERIRSNEIQGFARSYLRSWARRQPNLTADTELGWLFSSYYPAGIPRQEDKEFIEDAALPEVAWETRHIEEPMEEEHDSQMEEGAGEPMSKWGSSQGDNRRDNPERLPVTTGTSRPAPKVSRTEVSDEEKLDWGDSSE